MFFLIAEPEYHTEVTLPAFAQAELTPLGIQSTFSIQTDEADSTLPGLEGLQGADLLVLSVRRKHPPEKQMELIRTFLAAGKPIVGIRTASHAFSKKPNTPEEGAWESFSKDILGATYTGHYGVGAHTLVSPFPEAVRHPVLTGIPNKEFLSTSHLYKSGNLAPCVTPLLKGHLEAGPEQEPVAWVNTLKKQRIFYTSLGVPSDFELPAFRRLLLNGITWALGLPVPQDPAPPVPAPLPTDSQPPGSALQQP